MAAYLAERLIVWISSLAQDNIAIALAVVLGIGALGGLLLAAVLRLLRALLPFLVLAGVLALCWRTGLLGQCYHWLVSLGQ